MDDRGCNFEEKVRFDKYVLEIKVSKGNMQITLNGK
jgi:hypothetical protein